jgi:ubiquinone/menaquinone biosynthesis C-methylase UbiE
VAGSAEYVFGDNDTASRRLDLVGQQWHEPSAAFLGEVALGPPQLALDLGCGPGRTTRLVAATTGAARTVGIDSSAPFLARARADAPPGVTFVDHDVMELPFPTGPADLVYARFLLSHVPRPDRVMAAWMTALTPGGVIALDEVEQIDTNDATLAGYLELLGALMEVRGSALATGPMIDRFDGGPDGYRRTSDVRVHPVRPEVAAELFALNFETWRHEPSVADNHDADELDDLAASLRRIARHPGRAEITWVMRQATFERDG